MAAAYSRDNLRLLLATRQEIGQLAEVQTLLDDAAAAEQQPAPSVLRGCIVRLKYAGTYVLLPVEELVARQGGAPLLSVQAPAGQQSLRVKPTAASGLNPLDDEQWEAAGRAEAARLADHLWQHGQPMTLAEAAGIAWRKQAALQWHALHGKEPPAEQRRHLPALLQQLLDAAGIAEMQQQLEPEQRQPQQHDVVVDAALLPQPSQLAAAGAVAAHAQASQPAAVVAAAPPAQPQQAAAAAADAASPAAAAQVAAQSALRASSARSGPPAAQPGSVAQAPVLGTAAPASSLVAQLDRLQAAAASLAPGGSSADGSGGNAATVAALEGIQRQLRELAQLAQPMQPQPSAVHAPPHVPAQPAPEQQGAAAAQLPGSPACSRLLRGGYDSRPPAAHSREPQRSWADPLATMQPPAGFQPAGRPWPEAAVAGGPPWVGDSSSGSSTCLVRLPGNPSLSEAMSILAATLRRAVPCYERDFAAKCTALQGVLRLGLMRSKSGGMAAFQQTRVVLDNLADELQQAGREGAEMYRGRDGLQLLKRVLCDVKEAQLLELTRQPGQHEVLLRVDRLSAEFGRPEDLEAREAGAASERGAAARQPVLAASRHATEGSEPAAAALDPAQLRHLAPVQLLDGSWGLINTEVMLTCLPRLPEDQLLSELEAMCRDVGITAVSSRVGIRGGKRGDIAVLTFASPQEAALASERLQLAQFHGIALHCQPLEGQVDLLRQIYPGEAAAAHRIVAALESGALPSWPPASAGGHEEAEPGGRKRQRSRSRDGSRRSRRSSRGGASGEGRGLSPAELLLAPAFVRRTNYSGWELTCADIFLSGLQPGPQIEQMRFVEQLCERVGATVVLARCTSGDSRGDMAYLTLASAAQAARVIEQLSGTQVLGRMVFVRPLERNVESLRRRYPQLAAEADEALAAAKAIQHRRTGLAADVNAVPLGRQRQQGQQDTKRRGRSRSPSRSPLGRKGSRSRSRGRGSRRSRSRGTSRGRHSRRSRHSSPSKGRRASPASPRGRQPARSFGTPSRSASPSAGGQASGGGRDGRRTPARSSSPARSAS